MIKLTEKQKSLLCKYIPDYNKYTDVNDLLEHISDIMLESIDENDEATADTTIIDKLYDEIYVQNEYN